MSAVASLWAYFMIAVVTGTLFWVQLLLFIVLFPFDKRRYVVGRLFRLSSVISVKFNPLLNFRVVGKIPPAPVGTVIKKKKKKKSDAPGLHQQSSFVDRRRPYISPSMGNEV